MSIESIKSRLAEADEIGDAPVEMSDLPLYAKADEDIRLLLDVADAATAVSACVYYDDEREDAAWAALARALKALEEGE